MREWLWFVLWLGMYVAIAVLIGLSVAHSKERNMIVPLVRGDVDILARTLYGEARGEAVVGMQAVAWVVVNRARRGPPRFPGTILGVVTAKQQFSCWNKSDPNAALCRDVSERDPLFTLALYAAAGVLSGEVRDMTGGADHYHAEWMKPFPAWSAKMHKTAKIGAHVFYKE